MSDVNPDWVAHQRNRWLRPDWQRWVRHDARLFAPPGSDAPKSYAARLVEQRQAEEDEARLAAEEEELRESLLHLRQELAEVKFEFAWRRLCHKYGYNPSQPRVPVGSFDGGQWTTGGTEDGRIRIAQVGGTVTDAFGGPYYQPGGHHEMSRAVYRKWKLRPETLKVFEGSTIGALPPARLRTTPDGMPVGNFWNGKDGAHGVYNEAVQELGDRFLEKNNIKPENMTPDHAQALLKEIRETQDPRIRQFNDSMRLLRRLFRLRTGRGIE